MLKKILTCFSLMFLLICAAHTTAYAKPAELTAIDAFELDSETIRVEISYSGGKLDYNDVAAAFEENYIAIDLDNTTTGRISRVSGVNIRSGARDFVEKISANETKKKHTRILINFKSPTGDANVTLEPANRSEKKPARIIINIKKAPPQNWRDDSDYNGDGKIVVLDAGHGGSDSGAVGPTGVTEKSVSLAVSLKAQELLTALGYQVVMTRTTDIDVAAPDVSDQVELQARVDKAPPNAALFISIHCNAFSTGKANGMETYHAPTAVQGARLARLLNEELERMGGLNNRGVKAARFYVMTHSKCPASLIELGFITNHREEKLLASDDYQQKLAQAITNAVNRYFNQGGFD